MPEKGEEMKTQMRRMTKRTNLFEVRRRALELKVEAEELGWESAMRRTDTTCEHWP